MMNYQDIESMLCQEADNEVLFYMYKHKGGIDFGKKLVAGKILKERNYNPVALSYEKRLITEDLEKGIRELENRTELEEQYRNKLKNKIIIESFLGLIVLISIITLHSFRSEESAMDWKNISIKSMIIAAFLLFSAFNFRRRINQKMKEAERDLHLYKLRLEAIKRDWDF